MTKILDIDKLLKDLTKVSESLDDMVEGIADTIATKLVDDMKEEAYDKGKRIGKAYDDNLTVTKTVEGNTYNYLVELDDKADWAENGKASHWMGDYLLKGKNGEKLKSRVIPITNDFSDITNAKGSSNPNALTNNKQQIANELQELSTILSAADIRGKTGYNKFKMDNVKGTTAELSAKDNDERISASTTTFRTITDKDDGKKWMAPETQGAKLLEKLEQEAPQKIDEILQSILEKK